jgi:pilus assembly protein Flp/PilA
MKQKIFQALAAVRSDKRAVTALEYALIASLVAVAVITAASGLGNKMANTFTNITSHLA